MGLLLLLRSLHTNGRSQSQHNVPVVEINRVIRSLGLTCGSVDIRPLVRRVFDFVWPEVGKSAGCPLVHVFHVFRNVTVFIKRVLEVDASAHACKQRVSQLVGGYYRQQDNVKREAVDALSHGKKHFFFGKKKFFFKFCDIRFSAGQM
jgi:hypothetical protein